MGGTAFRADHRAQHVAFYHAIWRNLEYYRPVAVGDPMASKFILLAAIARNYRRGDSFFTQPKGALTMKRIALKGDCLLLCVEAQFCTRSGSKINSQSRHPEGRGATRRTSLAFACLPRTTAFLCDPGGIL